MQRLKGVVAAIAVLTLVPFLCPAGAQEAAPDDRQSVERLVEEHSADGRIQTERPQFQPEPRPPRRRSDNGFLEAIGRFFAWLFGNFGWLFRGLLVAAVVAVVGYVLWYMFGGMTLPGRREKKDADARDISLQDSERPAAGEARALLEEADRLAGEGRFAEAVHLLLFRSIEDLRARRTGGVPLSLTAREIQSLEDLSQRTRQALSPIIRLVERSFFGGRPVDAEGWQAARASYQDFAFGEARA